MGDASPDLCYTEGSLFVRGDPSVSSIEKLML
jgi:hypothetical protein